MTIKKTLIAGATASMMIASPIVAQTADRTSAPSEESEQIFGGNFLLTVLIVAGVVVGIVLLADDDDAPVSP